MMIIDIKLVVEIVYNHWYNAYPQPGGSGLPLFFCRRITACFDASGAHAAGWSPIGLDQHAIEMIAQPTNLRKPARASILIMGDW
jgi:hypothetical protein